MSTIIKKKAIPLRCQRCLHPWYYTGNNLFVATCPHCRTYVNIKKNRTKYEEIEETEKKLDSFDNIHEQLESNESIV